MYTVQYTVYTVQDTVYCTLYRTGDPRMQSMCGKSGLASHRHRGCANYSAQYIVQCTVHSTLYTLQCTVHCTVYSAQYTVQCRVYSVQKPLQFTVQGAGHPSILLGYCH